MNGVVGAAAAEPVTKAQKQEQQDSLTPREITGIAAEPWRQLLEASG